MDQWRKAKSVSFDDESLGNLGEVGRHVRDVNSGDGVCCGRVKDFEELRLTRVAG